MLICYLIHALLVRSVTASAPSLGLVHETTKIATNKDCIQKEEGVILTTECIMICRRKQKLAIFQNNKCYCTNNDVQNECFHKDSTTTISAEVYNEMSTMKVDVQEKTWKISFNLKPTRTTRHKEERVLRVTNGEGDDAYGGRNPDVLLDDQNRLLIHAALNNQADFTFTSNFSIPTDKFTRVKITQQAMFESPDVSKPRYVLSIYLDDILVNSQKNADAKSFQNMKIYKGDLHGSSIIDDIVIQNPKIEPVAFTIYRNIPPYYGTEIPTKSSLMSKTISATANFASFYIPFRRIEDHFIIVMKALFIPPMDGEYRFYVSCDDICQLSIGTNQTESTAYVIAKNTMISVGYEDQPQKISTPIALITGSKYYMEVIFQEHADAERLGIAMSKPGSGIEPIDTQYLHPLQ